jgi:hypothetical protein
MPLIAPQLKQQREQVTMRLDVDVLAFLKRYADFIASSLDYVVSQAVVMTFHKDQDFRQWLRDQHPQDADRLQKLLTQQARQEIPGRTRKGATDSAGGDAPTPHPERVNPLPGSR